VPATANLILEQVAGEAGYTRGALYHQFQGKEELALAVVEWVAATWEDEVWEPAQREHDPIAVLIALARGHIVFCRRDVARVMMALRMEFDRREHPVGPRGARGRAAEHRALGSAGRGRAARRLDRARPAARGRAARRDRGAGDGRRRQAHDEELAERVVRGVLGV
jgi:AcrR family transcriptional regulator